MSDDHPVPSARARALVSGAYDTHVHVGPDVMERRIDDLDLARRCAETGLAGFVLKSHYVPTAERAAVVRKAVPGVDVLGAVTLNGSVGGMNPAAVEIAGRQGARIVWMPTVDSRNQRGSTRQPICRARSRRCGARCRPTCTRRASCRRSFRWSTPTGGAAGGAAGAAGARAARHGAGHRPPQRCRDPGGRAGGQGGGRTPGRGHPPRVHLAAAVRGRTSRSWPRRGALLERCFTTPYTGKVAWADLFENIRAGRARALGAVQRPGSAVQPAGRGRAAALRRPAARRGFQRA